MAPAPLPGNRSPEYPHSARRRGLAGTVVLHLEIGDDGRTRQARVARSSGYDVLDAAALEAARSWRFEPARRAGVAIAAVVEAPVRFRLRR